MSATPGEEHSPDLLATPTRKVRVTSGHGTPFVASSPHVGGYRSSPSQSVAGPGDCSESDDYYGSYDITDRESRTCFRVAIMMCICLFTLGSYWVYETPGAIYSQLEEQFKGELTPARNMALYTVYAVPNILLAFFGGYVIDRATGVCFGAIIFSFCVAIGQLCFFLGTTQSSFWLALCGRAIMGLGGECLTVVQNTFTIRWFDGQYIALAFGLVVAFSRLGSSLSFYVTPLLCDLYSTNTAVAVGTVLCGISFLVACLTAALDYLGTRRLEGNNRVAPISSEDEVNARKLPSLPPLSWMLFAICGLFYSSVLVFFGTASLTMQHTGYELDAPTATLYLAIPNLVSIVASPIFGVLVDSKGRNLNWIMGACFLVMMAHAGFLGTVLGYFPVYPSVVFLLMGFGLAMGAASIWPCLANIVPPYALATGYGAMSAAQNVFLAVTYAAVGALQTSAPGRKDDLLYCWPSFILGGTTLLAFLLTVALVCLDNKYGEGRLNAPKDPAEYSVSGQSYSCMSDTSQASSRLMGSGAQGPGSWLDSDSVMLGSSPRTDLNNMSARTDQGMGHMSGTPSDTHLQVQPFSSSLSKSILRKTLLGGQ